MDSKGQKAVATAVTATAVAVVMEGMRPDGSTLFVFLFVAVADFGWFLFVVVENARPGTWNFWCHHFVRGLFPVSARQCIFREKG